MKIQYKSIQKGEPGVVGGGEKKYYAQIVRGRAVDIRSLVEEIAAFNTLTTTDILAVLESFLQTAGGHLASGQAVNLGQLGTFSPSLLSHSEGAAEDVDRQTIKRLKINFRPSALLSDKLAVAKYEKVSVETDPPALPTDQASAA